MADLNNVKSLALRIAKKRSEVLNQGYQASAREVQLMEKEAELEKIKGEIQAYCEGQKVFQAQLDEMLAEQDAQNMALATSEVSDPARGQG